MEGYKFGATTHTALQMINDGAKPCEIRTVCKVTGARVQAILQYLMKNGLIVRKYLGVYEVTENGKKYL